MIWGVVHRHSDGPAEARGALWDLRQDLVEICRDRLQRIFSTPIRAATQIGLGIDLSVEMIACGRNATRSISSLEIVIGRSRFDIAPPFDCQRLVECLGGPFDCRSATSPFGNPPCQGRQVGEGQDPTLDVRTFLIQNESFVKTNEWQLRFRTSVYLIHGMVPWAPFGPGETSCFTRRAMSVGNTLDRIMNGGRPKFFDIHCRSALKHVDHAA
jgi:hypothetical protein